MTRSLRLALFAGVLALTGCPKTNNNNPGADAGYNIRPDGGTKQCSPACQTGQVCNTTTGQCESCVETDTQFCTRLGKQCGPASGADLCGTQRDVSDCGSCGSGTCNAGTCEGGGVPPSNDKCPGAITLTFNNGAVTVTGNTADAIDDAQPTATGNCYTDGSGGDVVYKFTLTDRSAFSATVTFSDTNVYPLLLLRAACDSTADTDELDCQDYGYDGTISMSKKLDPGTYYLWVDGESASDVGAFQLDVQAHTLPPPPANDSCSAPATLDLSSGHATASGDTTSADETTNGGCGGYGSDVVYTFTTTDMKKLVVSVAGTDNNGLDPYVYLQTTCGDTSTEVTDSCATAPSSSVTATVNMGRLPAGTYFLWVDGTSARPGPFTLTADLSAPEPLPTNDQCSGVIALALNAAPVAGNNSYGTDDYGSGTTTTACESYGDASWTGRDLVYSYTPTADGKFTVTVTPDASTPFRAVVYAGTGTCGDLSTCVAADSAYNDGNKMITIQGVANTTYYIMVDGAYSTEHGAFTIDVKTTPVPANDTCAGAVSLTLNAAAVSGDTSFAANDYGVGATVAACDSGLSLDMDGNDVVYSYTPAADGSFTVTVTPSADFDVALYAMTGTCGDLNTCVAAEDSGWTGDAETITVTGTANTTYYFIVDGYSAGERGSFTIEVK